MKSARTWWRPSLCGVLMLPVALALVSPATAQTCVAPPNGLVGWWPAEGDAADLAGTSNGTLGNFVTFAPGMVGQAFELGDGGSFLPPAPLGISVGNAPALQVSTGDFTVELWFLWRRLGYRNQAPLVDKMGAAPNLDGWTLFEDECCGSIFRTGGGDHNTGTQFSVGGHPQPNVWYHAAAVKRGTMLELYLNGGQASTSVPIDVFYDTNTTNLNLGWNPTQGDFFVGLLDEISIYNRALDPGEIAAIHNAGSAGKCKAPLAIQKLAGTVLALNLQQGITNSLDAKLDAALQALDHANQNNQEAAINTLRAFINAVQAQRGKKIPANAADGLIASAQRIIGFLASP